MLFPVQSFYPPPQLPPPRASGISGIKSRCTLVLTYSGLLPHGEHRPSTTIRQRTRLRAVFSSSFQEWPLFSISASVSLRHVFLSLPLFLFSCWFQVRACLLMLLAGFLKGVANPTPISSADVCGHWFLICCLPQVFVSYHTCPPDTEDFAQTAFDNSLELMECSLSRSPWFRSIEEHWLHICVEYP